VACIGQSEIHKSNIWRAIFSRPLKEWGYKTSAGQVSWRGELTEEYKRRWGGGGVNQQKVATKRP
jgi:hypothetical protein